MSFQSGGFAYGGGVVQQRCASGWVWSQRMARRGLNPAPACVCVPLQSKAAVIAASWVLRRKGLQCWPRPGKRTGAAAELKISVPSDWSVSRLRQELSWLSC